MREELRDRLARTFASSRLVEEHAVGTRGVVLPDEDPFVRAFLRKAERIVYPAMMEIGRYVERHGRFFSIAYVRERETCRGAIVPTSVQMNFFRRHRTTNYKNENPHFNVGCDRIGRRVAFSSATVGGEPAEPCGQCSLDQLSRDLVQEKIAATLEAVLRL